MSTGGSVCPSCGHEARAIVAFCSECGFPLAQARGAEDDPLVGRALPGGYRIVEPLAEGSMGRVYRAEQSTLGRAVAVKVMNAGLVTNPQMVDRFKTEAKAASSLNHPNIVRVYDFGATADGRPYLVMELLQGQDLEALLASEPVPAIGRVLDITLQVLGALEEAHSFEVVHRDLKPANVFVLPQRGGGDLVKVVDFGLAKLRSALSTPGGLVFGTPEYITPEQAMAKPTDARTDVYACGVMLFEMIAGRLPFEADDPHRLLEMHVYDPAPSLSELVPDRVAFGLEAVVARALEKKPEDRFESAGAFADALRQIVAYRTGERTSTQRHSWVRSSLRTCTSCGNRVLPTARFCGECGEPLERESLAGPVSGRASMAPTSGPPRAAGPSVAPPLSESLRQSVEQAVRDAVEAGDANSALVFLEQVAASRMAKGEARAAIVALKRGIEIARADLDKGELEDPLVAVAIFSGKLAEAYLEAGELREAHHAFKDAIALSRPGLERAKLWRGLARTARAMGHDAESAEYEESAAHETAGAERRASAPPPPASRNAAR